MNSSPHVHSPTVEQSIMMDDAKTWHYGLIARWWREFNRPADQELARFRSVIEQYGEPALDLACGAGRLLIPLRKAGLDVDGCAISPDMLAHCRELAARDGISLNLNCQAMHELDLQRKYRTVYICDSFGIGGSRRDDQEALRRIHSHLEPGGALAFNNYVPYANPNLWELWQPQQHEKLPLPWPESGTRKTAENGDELEIGTRIYALDPREQRLTLQIRATLRRNGSKIEDEERFLYENLYFNAELVMMLEQTGFRSVEQQAGYTQRPAGINDTNILFIAQREPD